MKIKLREFTLEDLPSYEMYLRPENKWQEYDAPYLPDDSEQEIKDCISNVKNKLENNQKPFSGRKVIADIETNKLIGTVNCYWKSKETNWIEVGIGIYDENLWNKGIGYQALKLWINEVFIDHPELVRIGLSTWSGNIGMMKLAEKLGFKKEAEYRKARILKGKYYDSVSYGILKEEWYELNK
ncbi:MAG: hypothetical protein CR982_00465 [Candidatus Cloacimonadota bacterium]|nr:MAG: hypothetical protein CR982_00465 [Candidatus Cloacimonadota bacterium]PIE78772.1 MAG: hypothetical protein CSA15_06225 [Candidatus Delongbacteria bacterium]